MKSYYMHTINGQPARFVNGSQICYAAHYGPPNKLMESLAEIKAGQRATKLYREKRNMEFDQLDYGYVRFCLPKDANCETE